MCVSSIEVLHDGILYLVPVVMETWAKDVPDGSLRYFSEVADSRYPTVDVGVANTETGRHRMYSKAALLIIIMIHRTIMYNYTYVGHCGKMFAIIKQFVSDESLQHYSWLVIADDDTLLRCKGAKTPGCSQTY